MKLGMASQVEEKTSGESVSQTSIPEATVSSPGGVRAIEARLSRIFGGGGETGGLPGVVGIVLSYMHATKCDKCQAFDEIWERVAQV